METNDIRNRASDATRWSAVTEILAKSISPITNMILARLLTPSDFGLVATVSMVTSFADIFTDAGFQKYLVQHDFSDKEQLDRHTDVAFWTNLAISLILWGVIVRFRQEIASITGNDGLGFPIAMAALSLPLTSFSSLQMARYKREFNFKLLFYIRMLVSAVPLMVTIPIAILTHSFWALICGSLANCFLNACILTACSPWKPRLFYSFSILKEMFSYSWWILLESVAIWFTSYIGTFIVGKYLSTYYLGIYRTSIATVNQIMSLITATTAMPLFALLSRIKSDRQLLFHTYREYIQAIGIFIIPLGIGIWIYRSLITNVLLGSQWTEAADFIGLWGLMSTIMLVLGTNCNGLFNADGKTYLSLIAQVLHLVALIPLLIWASKRGYEVLFVTRSLIRLEAVAVELILMKLFLHFPIHQLFCDLKPTAVCSGVMVIVSMILRKISVDFAWQILSICVCVLVYFGAMLLLFREMFLERMEILGARVKR